MKIRALHAVKIELATKVSTKSGQLYHKGCGIMGIRGVLSVAGSKLCFIFFIFLFIFFQGTQQMAHAAQPVIFHDDLKREIKIFQPAVRIISLSEAHTENLVAIRAVEQLVGVSFSTEEKWVFKGIPRMSRIPSVTQIAELNPDLVVLDTAWAQNETALLKDLDKAKIRYVALNRPTRAALVAYTEVLGKIAGRHREAKQALVLSEKTLYKAAIRSGKNKRPKVFVIAGSDFSTCAANSWGARLIAASGGSPISDKNGIGITGYPWLVFFGPQKLAAIGKDVEVIITLMNNERRTSSVSKEAILKDPKLKNIPAVKNGRVWEMDESDLMLPSLVRLDSSSVKVWQLLNQQPVK